MKELSLRPYAYEACKICLFCFLLVGGFAYFGASSKELLIVLNLSVMSSSAVFSVKPMDFTIYPKASLLIVFFTLLGGFLGNISHLLSKIIFVAIASFSYYQPKKKTDFSILINCACVFLIFSSLPFDLEKMRIYIQDSLIFFVFFCFYHLFFIKLKNIPLENFSKEEEHFNRQNALMSAVALSASWILATYIQKTFNIIYAYWIPLTAILVIQGSYTSIIKKSLKRILANALGAIGTVSIFAYVLPPDFLVSILFLFVVLFFMFFFRYSYLKRTFFIEVYVLAFSYLFATSDEPVVLERVVFTILGSLIVIVTTLLFRGLVFRKKRIAP
jgi:hypothetical protein